MNKLRRNFHTDSETDCGNAKPKELSSEEQDHAADEYANDCHGRMHRRKCSYGHDCKGVVPNACLLAFRLGRKRSTIALVEIGLVGFEPTASWSRTRRSTKLSHSPKLSQRALYFAYFARHIKPVHPGRRS